MRRFFVGLFAVIGVLSVLVVVAVVVVVARLTPHVPGLPQRIVLRVDLSRTLADGAPQSPLQRIVYGARPTLRDVLDGIERAGDDPHVKGLVARVGDDGMGLAEVQQLRAAIARFRATGKFAIAFAASFGELGPGTRPYYLATACNEIWLQPMGTLGLTGLYAEVPFVKGTLSLLGVTADFEHRSEFKTAANSLTHNEMTPAQQEETQSLLASLSGQIVGGIARDRKLTPAAVRGLIDRGPFFATEARDAHLVDRLGYDDEALARAIARAGKGARGIRLGRYLAAVGHPHTKGAEIALIYGDGMITSRGSDTGALAGESGMSAHAITRAFAAAMDDKDVRAILFRIDSPGGSVVASESIWRAVALARERGKPVIVSMGEVAGSGGYYIAAPADKIVAEPATLTGSIGVLAGKLILSGLLQKLGINLQSDQIGANAGMFSATSDFSAQAKARLSTFLDLTYQGFKDHVAQGRHMTPEAVEAVAKGRVWTGEQAKKRGLVDALGGYRVALGLARAAARIPAGAPVRLVVFPQEETLEKLLFDRLFAPDRVRSGAAMGALGRALSAAQPLLQRWAALVEPAGLLMMPPFGPVR